MTVTKFEDHFSKQSSSYARYRFGYPSQLYSWLAEQCRERGLAWDCACGNGQAALGLAEYFDKVIATDGSAEQIANAHKHDKVQYKVCTAEDADIDSHSADIVVVAQALHWFDLPKFYAEARRIVKPGGLIATWCYVSPETDTEIASLIAFLAKHILKDYWSNKVRIAEQRYGEIQFPFEELAAPKFYATTHWTVSELKGYLNSWSATQAFIEATGKNPIEQIDDRLCEAFASSTSRKTFNWALPMRVGRLTWR